MFCKDCGKEIPNDSNFCEFCGYKLSATDQVTSKAVVASQTAINISNSVAVQAAPEVALLPLFPVATHKFIILSICTFGIYELYWCYQNWKRIKNVTGENLSPFWRAFFAPLWGFSLFKRIRHIATSQGLSVDWNATMLATLYLLLSALWRLPDPWWWISIASLVPLIPVQQAAQKLNTQHTGTKTEKQNDSYSTANILTIIVGGLFIIMAIIGTFMPE